MGLRGRRQARTDVGVNQLGRASDDLVWWLLLSEGAVRCLLGQLLVLGRQRRDYAAVGSPLLLQAQLPIVLAVVCLHFNVRKTLLFVAFRLNWEIRCRQQASTDLLRLERFRGGARGIIGLLQPGLAVR